MRPWAELIDKIRTSTSTGQGSGAKNGGFPSLLGCWTFRSKMRSFWEEQQDAEIVIANSTFGAVLPLTILNAMEASHAGKDDEAIRRHQPLIFALTESTTLLSAIATNSRRCCAQCGSRSVYGCQKYNKGLCPECFLPYHTR